MTLPAATAAGSEDTVSVRVEADHEDTVTRRYVPSDAK
jgi:hypothetical protein